MSEWDIIIENYKNAVNCLWWTKGKNYWCRDTENGLYHLLTAYRLAEQNDEKNHLYYARILAMMSDEMRGVMSEYEIFNRYIKPSLNEYELAKQNGSKPTEKELQKIKIKFETLNYKFLMTSNTNEQYENSLKLIDKHELLENFAFHDSRPVFFSHDEERAILKLDYYGNVATFEFKNISDVEINCEVPYSWVYDFYCYRRYSQSEVIVFDIELYKIACKSISVIGIEYKKTDN